MVQLWKEAEILTPDNLPAWLTIEDAGAYRYLGSASWAELRSQEREAYGADLEELEAAGLIVDQDPNDCRMSHLFIALPPEQDVWSIGIYTGPSPFALAP